MKESRLRQGVAAVGLAVSGIIVLAITLWPTPVDRGLEGPIARVLAALHRRGLPAWFDYRELEFTANIAMFVPLGFLLALLVPLKYWWVAVAAGPAASMCIEFLQWMLLHERFASLADVVANSTGAVIGCAVAFALRALVEYRDRRLIAAALERELCIGDASQGYDSRGSGKTQGELLPFLAEPRRTNSRGG